jgi:hypothetical protein
MLPRCDMEYFEIGESFPKSVRKKRISGLEEVPSRSDNEI